MPRELWGTFSVADHLRERAFVADMLLYDRLVIPVPPKGDEGERDYWHERGWKPDDLESIIERVQKVNADLLCTIPWDKTRRQEFAERYKSAVALAGDTHRLAREREMLVDPNRPEYGLTRMLLYEHSNNPTIGPDLPPGVWVEAMTAYPSYQAFTEEVKLDQDTVPKPEDKALAGVFGWEFFAPDEPTMNHLELLEGLAQFVKEGKFSEKRRAFHDKRRKLLSEGAPNKQAIEEMNQLAADYARATQAKFWRNTALNGFTILGIGASVASGLGVATAGLVGAFFTTCRFVADQWLTSPENNPEHKAGAMVHDARNWFKKRAGK